MNKALNSMLALSVVTLAGCSHNQSDGQRFIASEELLSPEQPELIHGEKWTNKDAINSQVVLDIFRKNHRERTGSSKTMRRDAHPKHHGCVKSSLVIDNSNLPENLKVGLFEKNAKYTSSIRFSNGNPDHTKEDGDADVRGFALKVDVDYPNYLQDIGVEGGENVHDFVFMNADSFFIPNSKKYRELMEYGVPKYMLHNPSTAWRLLGSLIKPGNPLDIDYHSSTPYRLGDTTMKMMFKSCRTKKSTKPWFANANYLGQRLEKSLSGKSSCFEMYVQPNKDKKINNIENAMVNWKTRKSPRIKVGVLNIPKQEGFRSKEEMKKCEDMTFNPWRAHNLNRPVGAVNRVRLDVYINQARMRHEYNGINQE